MIARKILEVKAMKLNSFKYMVAAGAIALAAGACTNLDETLYDQVGSQNYYNTKNDVIRAVFRPFEHAFWSIQRNAMAVTRHPAECCAVQVLYDNMQRDTYT